MSGHLLTMMYALVFVVFVSVTHATCPDHWVSDSGHCYYLSHTELPWTEATEMCRSFGASLFTYSSDVGIESLLAKLRNVDHVNQRQIWVGATDEIREGHWTWVVHNREGIPHMVTVDTFGQESVSHNSGNNNCLSLRMDRHSYNWYSDGCSEDNYYMCVLTRGGGEITYITSGQDTSEIFG